MNLINEIDFEVFVLRLMVIVLTGIRVSAGLDCFKCVSVGGSNSACEDPFHNNYTTDILESPCWAGRKHRDGLFPATACIKLSGVYEDTGETMIVRGCALDSGTLTIDTEIVRMSHCGGFYFDERYVSGCLQSCFEDACNEAPSRTRPHLLLSCVLLMVFEWFRRFSRVRFNELEFGLHKDCV